MTEESRVIKRKKHQARIYSIKDGIFHAGRLSFADRFLAPFAIAVQASNSLVALLSSITGILGPLNQLLGVNLLNKYNRKKLILKSVLGESLSLLLFAIIAFLFYKGIVVEFLPLAVLISFAIFVSLANLGHPGWFSWMGDIVDETHRGRWFSKRNLLTGFVSIILAVLASFFLDYFKKNEWTMFGFMILFFLAFVSRMLSRKMLKKQYEPKIEIKNHSYPSFIEFLLNAPKNNLGRYTIFRSLIAFASAISTPLLAVYLLRTLHFNYLEYILITLGGTFVSLFVLGLWGKF
jgi:MFS family permease